MMLIQLVGMIAGVLFAVSGLVVHEAGAGPLLSDMQQVPGGEWVMYHPMAAMLVGVALILVCAVSNRRLDGRY